MYLFHLPQQARDELAVGTLDRDTASLLFHELPGAGRNREEWRIRHLTLTKIMFKTSMCCEWSNKWAGRCIITDKHWTIEPGILDHSYKASTAGRPAGWDRLVVWAQKEWTLGACSSKRWWTGGRLQFVVGTLTLLPTPGATHKNNTRSSEQSAVPSQSQTQA